MNSATEKQLRERWKTPEGEKVRKQIIDHVTENNWERFLVGFPFVEEVKNRRDLRYINLAFEHFTKSEMKYLKKHYALVGPNFTAADLTGADFMEANLRFTNFENAIIVNTNMISASLNKSNLVNTLIKNSNLIGANLSNSNLSNSKIVSCNIYGISAWNIKTNKSTIMKDLIINKDPLITVDDIEVAQFIYLILNNEKISNLITTMRTKGVLILGSFDDDSKPILNKLTEILPKHDLIPMIFYFKPPKEHRFMETVKTMALLSKFVIVDLSKRSGQLYEIANLVKDVKVPYITIAIEGTKVSVMLEDLHDYYWYRKDYFPYPEKEWEKELPELVKNEVIPWAKKINNKLLENRDREN